VGLHVIAEGHEEHLVADHCRQLGRGGAGGDEGDAGGLEEGCYGQCEGGVALPDAGRETGLVQHT
jgi:hypothetical protein